MILEGSIPQVDVNITRGSKCLILDASSLAAKPGSSKMKPNQMKQETELIKVFIGLPPKTTE